MIGSRLAARREAAPQRVGGLLDDAFGPYKGPQDLADEIAAARQPAGPAYELAKTHVVDPEDALAKIDGLLKTFGPKSDIGQSLQKFFQPKTGLERGRPEFQRGASAIFFLAIHSILTSSILGHFGCCIGCLRVSRAGPPYGIGHSMNFMSQRLIGSLCAVGCKGVVRN